MVRHCLFLECKKSEKPWVIFTSRSTPYDLMVTDLPHEGFDPLDMLDTQKDIDDCVIEFQDKIHPLWKSERIGRTSYEGLKHKSGSGNVNNTIFSALTTAVKATIAGRKDKFGAGSDFDACYYYPMIILDGRLFEAYLQSGEIQVREVNSVMFSFYYQSRQYKREQFIVPILTEGALKDFLLFLDSVLLFLGNLVEQQIQKHPPTEIA